MIEKTTIQKIIDYDYTLVNQDGENFIKNIEFYSNYKPDIGDIIYISKKILNEKNIFSFDEIYETFDCNIDDIIKVVHDNKVYYFQRRYG